MSREPIRDEQGRYPPGVSGNPSGRPKVLPPGLMVALREMLGEPYPDDPENLTYRDRLIRSTLELAIRGHPQALQLVWNRVEGLVPQRIEDSGDGIPVIQLTWVKPDADSANNGTAGGVPRSLPPANGTS